MTLHNKVTNSSTVLVMQVCAGSVRVKHMLFIASLVVGTHSTEVSQARCEQGGALATQSCLRTRDVL